MLDAVIVKLATPSEKLSYTLVAKIEEKLQFVCSA